jgi:unsaturated rhamnogalacturonyl hydrolase
LFGVIPFLTKMWTVTGDARYLDEAVAQVEKHAAHLQDPSTGLYRHAWSEPLDAYSGPYFWGRGNGWVLMAQAQLLTVIPAGDARRPTLLTQFERQAQALIAGQAPNGMWHTIVTRSDFYEETSATALISAALALASTRGLFEAQLRDQMISAAQAGRAAVWQHVSAGGVVRGVSGPTGPMEQETAYNAIPILDFALYGQGAALLAGAAAVPAR